MKFLSRILLIAFTVLAFAGCKKEQYGSISIGMTDAPGDYLQINVEILKVDIHFANGKNGSAGWMGLSVNNGIYDLLTLKNNVSIMLASGTKMPVGNLNKIKLTLGIHNTAMLNDSSVVNLNVPPSLNSEIIVYLDTEINKDNTLTVTLDFDGDASFLVDKLTNIMQPVIKVKSTSH